MGAREGTAEVDGIGAALVGGRVILDIGGMRRLVLEAAGIML